MNNPRISIITVSFNAEKYIERTIKSVIEQTYKNIEFIVVDGASKDGTVQLIKQYESHIDKWISEKDKSHFDAMNKGLAMATGDYVWYMNAGDCIYDSETLEKIIAASNGEDFLYGDTVIVTEDGAQRKWHKNKPSDRKISYKSFMNGMVICHHSMMIKRDKAEPYALEPWKVSNDIEWAIRITKNSKSFKDTGNIWCRYLDGGISADNRWKSVTERFSIGRKHYGFFPILFEQIRVAFQIIKRGRIS